MLRILSVLLLLMLAACGGADAPTEQAPPAAANAPVEIEVTLSEFKFDISQTTFKVGTPYRFVVKNTGAVPHEFMISMPMMPGMNHGSAHSMAVATIFEDQLPAGATQTIDVTFDKPSTTGALEFACHVVGHYEAGMHLPITVE